MMLDTTEDNACHSEPAESQLSGNTSCALPSQPRQVFLRALSTDPEPARSQPSVLPSDFTPSGSTACEKRAPRESIYSLLSTAFGSTPSLALSFDSCIGSADTPNDSEIARKMSVPVTTVDNISREKYGASPTIKMQLDTLMDAHPLPELASGPWIDRWRIFRYNTMSAYMRLWALAILTNLVIIIAMICQVVRKPGSFTYGAAATAAGANLLVTALMRHEHCINLLFRLATALPHRTPLAIRRQAAKVYSYGGVHSGCGVAALLWYVFYTGLAIVQFEGNETESIALAATTALILLCICVIIGMAHPKIRIRWHNQWEMSHRFAGWTAIALLWAQTMVLAIASAHHAKQPLGATLVKTPTFWFIIVITCCLIYPWLRLRKRAVTPEVLSSHAVRLWFDDKTMPSCVGARLSTRPLTENHGFATIPNAVDIETGLIKPQKARLRSSSSSTTTSTSSATSSAPPPIHGHGKGFSVLVSRAGDFTSSLIDSPPTKIYTRGAPTRGVLHIAHLFRPFVLIATGSGIGPCLSFLQVYPHYPVRVIWSAREPGKTYGPEVVGAVMRADKNAVVIDTQEYKKPNLSAIGWALARETGSEAVVIISNPFTTRKVVFALESRGLPAFGAIFDS